MYEIPVYTAERDAGLVQLIQSTAKVSLASQVRLSERFAISQKSMARLCNLALKAKGSVTDDDLYFLSDILVSVGWNKNDDVFDPVEMWLARATPSDKPFNYEHDCKDIIGHTVGCKAITVDGKDIPDDTIASDLPAKFHILAQDVIYKYWEDPKLQERMDRIIAEIQKTPPQWFVSMECLFKGFDYALKTADGRAKVVARNDKTAFLTKHLRVYGGDGQYGEYRVGRLLRNILFSGKGLVRNPANPESVIVDTNPSEFSATKAEIVSEISKPSEEQVYQSSDGANDPVHQSEDRTHMATEVETLQKKLDAALAEVEALKAAQHENNVKAIASAKEKAEAQVAELTSKLQEANKAVESAAKASDEQKAQVEKLTKELEESNKALAEVKDELKGIYAEQKKNDRIAKVKAALKVDEAKEESVKKALALAESLMDLPDDKFENVINAMASQNMMTDSAPTNNPAEGNTSFPNQAKPKEQPKSTDKPTGADQKAAGTGMDNDADDDAAANASTEVLDQVQADKTQAALSTVPAGDGVNDVARQIASAFGYKPEE